MFSTLKIVATSAVLSGLVVGILWTVEAQTIVPPSTKAFVDRLPQDGVENTSQRRLVSVPGPATQTSGAKADRITVAQKETCSDAAWPYLPQECLTRVGRAEPRTSIRVVTIETRQGDNISILTRLPQTVVAAR